MIVAIPVAVYLALACATVVPPPGQPAVSPTKAVTKPVAPAWDLLGACTALNKAGVQTYPSLNPK